MLKGRSQRRCPMVSLSSLSWDSVELAPIGKADKEWDWLDTWHQMEDVYLNNKDKVRAIGENKVDNVRVLQLIIHRFSGVSNFSVPFLERLLQSAKVVPAVNQVELHPCVS